MNCIVGHIYCVTCLVNGKMYIGQTTNTIEKRFNGHIKDSKKSDYKFYRAIRKYGPENFTVEELASYSAPTKQELKPILDEAEKKFIKQYDSRKRGYNSTDGGDGSLGLPCSEEKKKKISESLKGVSIGRLGRPLTEEEKRRMSESCKKYWANHDNWIKGRAGTPEAKRVGRKLGTKLPQHLVEKQCEVFRKYYETHDVWNKGKTFRKPDLEHVEMNISKPERRVIQLTPDGCFVRDWGSASAAAHILGLNPNIIRSRCKSDDHFAYGYLWINKCNYAG